MCSIWWLLFDIAELEPSQFFVIDQAGDLAAADCQLL
jgi:hypothetical protein